MPVLRQFRPELILISAGFDACADDPLGGMRLSPSQFARLTALVLDVADDCCDGRVVAVTEGGYNLAGLAACLRAVVGVLSGEVSTRDCVAPTGDARRGRASIAAVAPHVREFWTI